MSAFNKILLKDFQSRSDLEHVILMSNASQDVREDAAMQLETLETNCRNAIQANVEVAKLNAALQEKIEYLEGWKIAIDDACINDWVSITTPKETINNLIACNVKEALDPAISEKPAKWVAEISELKENIKAIESNYDALQSPMPCGHLARYAVNEKDGTQYCVMCLATETEKTLQIAKSALGQIASGNGVYGQQAYQYKQLAKSTMEKL